MAATSLIWYGLSQVVRFQPQERIWTRAVTWASYSSILILGLMPFAHWWSRYPAQPLFVRGLYLLFFAGVSFGLALSHLLVRLSAMLPDEILRGDTRLFARVNQVLLLALMAMVALDYAIVRFIAQIPPAWLLVAAALHDNRSAFLLLGALIPLAVTMTLVWKAKETIIAGVYRGV
jgi:hypothetical protein